MSRQNALDIIKLRPTPRWGHTEYSLYYHHDYIRKKTGMEPLDPRAVPALHDMLGLDFVWWVHDGPEWSQLGRYTDMGHAVYASDGSDLHQPAVCPFNTVEEVWAFDAVAEYGLPDLDRQVWSYEKAWREMQAAYRDQLVTGGYYKTIVSGAIQAFGWDMLLEAASEPDKLEPVLDSFYRYTRFFVEAWAKTSAEVFIQHDDFVWTSGAFMRPEIYRQVIIPRYAELWKVLHAAGKKVLFCSDGVFTEFAEDIAEAGADGFIFEPDNPFEFMVERFGRSHALIGSAVDCRDMTFGSWETVQKSIERTLDLAEKCAGLIFAVGNHIPGNVSDDMLDSYMSYLQTRLARPTPPSTSNGRDPGNAAVYMPETEAV